ncbi:hypothetical protein [Mycobacterium sp. PSTR-4-N]|uniref:hypothetical protein n=1 Tax=Mycobacterium sp. PSTR-4-N TaxID=2917745 RepID=UPI001F153E72|nr:hypothetical protein [Mycobacterium sp. PSTR-4-N]MCG7596340.1 hypothetical protein [Mycobacterium sp. PSTR-4-N]
MLVEQFTATAICPKCGACDVHPFRMPRHEPKGDSPLEHAQRAIGRAIDISRAITGLPSYFDPDNADVMRQCNRCEWEWPQQ